MSCDITKGKIVIECKDAVSGIKAIYLVNYDDYSVVTTSGTASGHEITDIGSVSECFKYVLKNSANTFQQDITSSRDNGTTLYTQTLNFTLNKLNAEMEYQIRMMSLGRPIIFIEANSGQFLCIGLEHGCEITGAGQIQGTIDSINAYVMTAIGTESQPVWYLDTASIAALQALVSTSNLT